MKDHQLTDRGPHDPSPGNTEATPPVGSSGGAGSLMRLVNNQGLVFLLVGGFNTALGTAWFAVWWFALGDQLGYHFAIVAGYLCNVLCAFAMYRYLVFEVRGHFTRDFWRFVVVNSGAFAVTFSLMTLAVTVLNFPPVPSQVAITAITATASFLGYRDFSFSRKKRTGTS